MPHTDTPTPSIDIGSRLVWFTDVKAISKYSITLDHGTVANFGPHTVHVDCSARGQLGHDPVPVWQGDTVVPQPCFFCNQALSSALLGHLEGSFPDDTHEELKNALGAPIPPTHTLGSVLIALEVQHKLALLWGKEPKVKLWLRKQMIYIDTPTKYEQVCREDTMGAIETATTSQAIQKILKVEAARTINKEKLGAAQQAVALPVAKTKMVPAASSSSTLSRMQMKSKL